MSELGDDYRAIKQEKAKDRASKEPERLAFAVEQLQKAGHIVQVLDDQKIRVNGKITLWVFTGWFSGKGVKSGRGVHNLIKELLK